MRIRLTLDPDVAAKAMKAAVALRKPFRDVIHDALRVGLDAILPPPSARPYKTIPRPMGLRPGLSYDNVEELITVGEGDRHR